MKLSHQQFIDQGYMYHVHCIMEWLLERVKWYISAALRQMLTTNLISTSQKKVPFK